jgi:hypothetical protein
MTCDIDATKKKKRLIYGQTKRMGKEQEYTVKKITWKKD